MTVSWGLRLSRVYERTSRSIRTNSFYLLSLMSQEKERMEGREGGKKERKRGRKKEQKKASKLRV